MKTISAFWRQPSSAYRNFQLVFTLLSLNFIIPAFSYALAPQIVAGQFHQINQLMGGTPYTFPEEMSRMWRYLGAANVMTLGLMCFMLQLNLRKFKTILIPLCFLKGYNALLFLLGFFATPEYRVFLAIALLDFITTAAFIYFAGKAIRETDALPDSILIPPPGLRSSL
ncbi:MAG: hypothetical protein A2X86_18605 [Bdellovibrionales bacterium GWA2_49_15]|nr:MAG: hypothetical protein A2X86_18605 [Bdellovibrionales bacterium GWA2_49_15]HAZ11536.1 hypothetical protein [Bdellovibrionales bacterium]